MVFNSLEFEFMNKVLKLFFNVSNIFLDFFFYIIMDFGIIVLGWKGCRASGGVY